MSDANFLKRCSIRIVGLPHSRIKLKSHYVVDNENIKLLESNVIGNGDIYQIQIKCKYISRGHSGYLLVLGTHLFFASPQIHFHNGMYKQRTSGLFELFNGDKISFMDNEEGEEYWYIQIQIDPIENGTLERNDCQITEDAISSQISHISASQVPQSNKFQRPSVPTKKMVPQMVNSSLNAKLNETTSPKAAVTQKVIGEMVNAAGKTKLNHRNTAPEPALTKEVVAQMIKKAFTAVHQDKEFIRMNQQPPLTTTQANAFSEDVNPELFETLNETTATKPGVTDEVIGEVVNAGGNTKLNRNTTAEPALTKEVVGEMIKKAFIAAYQDKEFIRMNQQPPLTTTQANEPPSLTRPSLPQLSLAAPSSSRSSLPQSSVSVPPPPNVNAVPLVAANNRPVPLLIRNNSK